jgi:hypothetical protein
MMVAVALGVLVASDAGAGAGLAWVGAALGAAILALGLVAGSTVAVQASVGILGALLLLRADDRLLLAPLYGGGLLGLSELGRMSIELAGVPAVAAGAPTARLGWVLAVAGAGTGAAGLAAAAVLAAPGRSVAVTAAGAVAVVVATGTVVWLARRRGHWSRSTVAASSADGLAPKMRS